MREITIPRLLSLEDVWVVANNNARVRLSKVFVERIQKAHDFILNSVSIGKTIYGVTTGIGALVGENIGFAHARELQEKLLLSHAVGFGEYVDRRFVRATMFIRANMLARGYSGVRPEIIVLLCSLLNENIVPCVPKYGSVGASGDLAPLSHIGLVVVGSGKAKALVEGRIIGGLELKKILYSVYTKYLNEFYSSIDTRKTAKDFFNIRAIDEEDSFLVPLTYKEGLALINGTDYESAILAITIYELKVAYRWAEVALALTMEGMRGIIDAFDDDAVGLLNNSGALAFARRIRELLRGSKLIVRKNDVLPLQNLASRISKDGDSIIIEIPHSSLIRYGLKTTQLLRILEKKLVSKIDRISHENSDGKFVIKIYGDLHEDQIRYLQFRYGELGFVQDPYSIRCAPKVFGIVREYLGFAERVLLEEINAITDNPLLIPSSEEYRIISAGNFHGQPLAFIADTLAIIASYIAGMSERRIFRLLDENLNRNLPPFLIKKHGLNTGLMITQYVAAALHSINCVLSHPSSIYSIPTSANQEDWNSMGANSALKLVEVTKNLQRIIATEILCASQAIMLRTNGDMSLLGEKTRRIVEKVSKLIVLPISDDRYFKDDIDTIQNMLLEEPEV